MILKLQKSTKYLVGLAFIVAAALFAVNRGSVEAACPSQDTSRGTVTSTFNVPSTGTYYVWARMQASSSTNDSFTMELDGSVCGITVGDTSVPTSGWKWVGYKSGNTGTRNTVNLSAGNHTMTMIGREDAVKVDRVLFITDANCTPSDATKGDNCVTNNDGTLPQVSISSPANNATISGNATIQANASDNVGVTNVDFYMGSTKLGSDTTSPYTFNLNTAAYTDGQYQLSAIAYDANDNQQRSSEITVNISNADTTPPSVTVTAPVNNTTVSGNMNIAANVTDSSGISSVEFQVDGQTVKTFSTGPYTYGYDTTALTNASHTVTVKATDTKSNQTQKSVTVTVNNAAPQEKLCDFNSDNKVDLFDLAYLINYYKKNVTAKTNGDCDGSGYVDLTDLAILISKYGTVY